MLNRNNSNIYSNSSQEWTSVSEEGNNIKKAQLQDFVHLEIVLTKVF